MTFKERKKERTEHYRTYIKGWRLKPCSAGNGSGYYDNANAPECSACDGSGQERYKVDLGALAPLIGCTLSEDAGPFNIHIENSRSVIYENDCNAPAGRRRTTLHYDYDMTTKVEEWYFTLSDGHIKRIRDFTPIKQKQNERSDRYA